MFGQLGAGQRAHGVHDRAVQDRVHHPERRWQERLGLRDVERETAEWVRWYNHERIQSSIDYMTPIEREVVYANAIV